VEKLRMKATLDRLLATELRGFCEVLKTESMRKRFVTASELGCLVHLRPVGGGLDPTSG
jgi:hypothetical protein